MSKSFRILLALVLLVAGVWGESAWEKFKEWNNNTPTVVVDITEPTLEYKTLVSSIVSMNIEANDANQISAFFLELADVVKNDPGFIETTGQFREFNTISGGLNFAGLEMKGKYPLLGEAIDQAIVNSIGLESSAMTSSKRSQLVQCLNAIAWAVQQ